LFPRFHIIRRDAGEILGSVTSTTFGTETWVRDECLGCLMAEETFIFGRWHKGGYARRNFWAFVPDNPDVTETLLPNTEWAVLDGYWGERAELVLDTTRKWQKSLYDDSDHDHCAICCETVGKAVNRMVMSAKMQRGFVAAAMSPLSSCGRWISFPGRIRSNKDMYCLNFSRERISIGAKMPSFLLDKKANKW
jgi:hypothetical protein